MTAVVGADSAQDIAASIDVASWVLEDVPLGDNFQVAALTAFGGLIIAALAGSTTPGQGLIFTTPDTVTWTPRFVMAGASQSLFAGLCVIPNTGIIIGVGHQLDGSHNIEVIRSLDGGITWAIITGGGVTDGAILSACAATDAALVVAGFEILNGVNWTPLAYSTSNGASFTPITTPWDVATSAPSSGVGTALGTDGSNWVMLGANAGLTQSILAAHAPAGPWVVPAVVPSAPVFYAGGGVAYSPALALWAAVGLNAAGSPTVLTASDPFGTWTARSTPADFGGHLGGNPVFRAITWDPVLGLFIAVGTGQLTGGGAFVTVMTSADGIAWVVRPVGWDSVLTGGAYCLAPGGTVIPGIPPLWWSNHVHQN